MVDGRENYKFDLGVEGLTETLLTEHSFCVVVIQPESSDFTQQPASLSFLFSSDNFSCSLLSHRIHGANFAPILIKPAC